LFHGVLEELTVISPPTTVSATPVQQLAPDLIVVKASTRWRTRGASVDAGPAFTQRQLAVDVGAIL
jgi:hypothetical protein